MFLITGRHDVELKISSDGSALMKIDSFEMRSVSFLPTFDQITPKFGSLQGHTLLSVQVSIMIVL